MGSARFDSATGVGRRFQRGVSRAGLFFVAAATIVLSVHARHYFPFLADDAMISLVYSERLMEGKGLTWNDGVRVEGYSNLLWVLGCAFLGLLGMDLMVASRLLGFACTVGVFVACVRYSTVVSRAPTSPDAPGEAVAAVFGGGIAAVLLATTGTVAVWSIGGLEQPLVCFLLAWSIVVAAANRRYR